MIKPKKNTIIVIASILVIAAIGVNVFNNIKKKAAAEKARNLAISEAAQPRPITVFSARKTKPKSIQKYPGIVKAAESSDLSFRVSGPLVKVNVEKGKPVKKGELLMQIDPRDFEDKIATLEAQLARETVAQKKAHTDFKRFEKLFNEDVISQADFDNATTAKESADAAIKMLKANLNIARHALEDTSLKAPFDGTVTKQNVENFQIVPAGAVVLNFRNIDKLEVTVSIPANQMINHANSKLSTKIAIPGLEGKSWPAKLIEWSAEADPVTQTYATTFEFNAPKDFRILPGMSAEIIWQENGAANSEIIVVPASAIFTSGTGTNFVWVFSNDKAEKRFVKTDGLFGSDKIIISSGLKAGENVVTGGSRLIHDGQSLTVLQNH